MPGIVRSFGSWTSPIDAAAVAREPGWGYDMVTPAGGAVYWLQARPLEGGREALVVRTHGTAPVDVLAPEFSVRTRVHEYGGGAFTVHGRAVFFCSDADQRVYRLDPGGSPRPVTPEGETPFALRYADLRVTPDGAWVVCVREREAQPEHVNELVAFPADGSAAPHVLVGGHDFFAAPRVSPGRPAARLAGLGPPADAVGGLGAVAGRAGRRRRPRRRPRGRRAGGGARPAGVEPGRRPARRARTAAAGGTCTGWARAAWSR